VIRHVERDHAEAVGHRGIVEHMAILAAVGTAVCRQSSGMPRPAPPHRSMRRAFDLDRAVAPGNGLELSIGAPSRA